MFLEPQTTIKKWMFCETTISYVKIGNHPSETTIYKWLFGVPGSFSKVLTQADFTLKRWETANSGDVERHNLTPMYGVRFKMCCFCQVYYVSCCQFADFQDNFQGDGL